MTDELALWQWYAAHQIESCANCKKIMCGHTVAELERCAAELSIIPPFKSPEPEKPFKTLEELRARK